MAGCIWEGPGGGHSAVTGRGAGRGRAKGGGRGGLYLGGVRAGRPLRGGRRTEDGDFHQGATQGGTSG
jgi:hypothetical protein